MGQMDTIKVEVVAGEGTIQEINILEHEETPEYLADAKEEIPPQILEEQKLDGVDLVSGATGSSEGILEATREALEKAMEN